MKHISILIPQGHTNITNIEGTHQIFSEANSYLATINKSPLFNIQLVGINAHTSQRNCLYTIKPNKLMHEVNKTDLIIIPAMLGDLENAIQLNQGFIPLDNEALYERSGIS